jgi:hypothetical protein
MIPTRYTRLVYAFFMALLVSMLVSLAITLSNLGFVDGLLIIWLRAWLSAWLVAFPSVTLMAPLVNRLVAVVVKGDENGQVRTDEH